MAAAVDSNATVGNTDLTSAFGFWSGASLALGLAICLLLTGLFLARPMNRMGLFTLADFYRLRYGRGVEVASSVLMIFAFAILMAGNLVACGFLLERFLGLDYTIGVVLAVVLVLVYTIGGGMFSDAYTAAIQIAITSSRPSRCCGGSGATFGFAIPEGMGPFDFEQLTSTDAGAPINWATLLALGIGDIVAIDFMQRIFSAKSPEVARRSCFTGAAGTAVIGVAYALVSLAAVSALGLDMADGPVLFTLLADYAPPALTVLVLSGHRRGVVLDGVRRDPRDVGGRGPQHPRRPARRHRAGRRRPAAALDPARDDPGRRPRHHRRPRRSRRPASCSPSRSTSCSPASSCRSCSGCSGSVAAPAPRSPRWPPGSSSGSALFVLTPTMYGVPNDVLYVPNGLVDATFDGWPTIYGGLASLVAYLVAALVWPRTVVEEAWAIADGDLATPATADDGRPGPAAVAEAVAQPASVVSPPAARRPGRVAGARSGVRPADARGPPGCGWLTPCPASSRSERSPRARWCSARSSAAGSPSPSGCSPRCSPSPPAH